MSLNEETWTAYAADVNGKERLLCKECVGKYDAVPLTKAELAGRFTDPNQVAYCDNCSTPRRLIGVDEIADLTTATDSTFTIKEEFKVGCGATEIKVCIAYRNIADGQWVNDAEITLTRMPRIDEEAMPGDMVILRPIHMATIARRTERLVSNARDLITRLNTTKLSGL